MKSILWSIKKEHLDNIKMVINWMKFAKRFRQTYILTRLIIYTKQNQVAAWEKSLANVILKTKPIYADIIDGTKHLYNTAFIKPCISNERLFDYLYDSTKKDGWALRISDLVIYDKPRELSDFATLCKGTGSARNKTCKNCWYLCFDDDPINGYTRCGANKRKTLTCPPQSWCYVEELR